ncbi:hypothetical protein [Kribbella sp. CA-293567]|uniref:hypothetical protein n=1 Tax=Kribbella sp. CA-293567 TaxID=3002436 RepID=UPI0022DE1116|nr:hypothetical protein [Kribbella sp. CA-293567]WBQ04206.1 hypothetical protein OX958_30090 [Kribbella sp. CA-293567]
MSVPVAHPAAAFPSTARVLLTVQLLTLRLWFNDLGRSLHSRAQAWVLVGAFGAAIAGFTVWSSLQSARQLGVSDLTGAETTYSAITFTVPALTTLMVGLYVPSRTLVTEILSVMPVTDGAVRAAVRAMTGTIGGFAGAVLLAPLWAPVLIARGLDGAPVVASLFWLGLGGVLIALALEAALSLGYRTVFRMGTIFSRGLAALSAAVLLALAFADAMPMNGNIPGGLHQTFTAGLVDFAESGTAFAPATSALLLPVLAVAVLWACGRSPELDSGNSLHLPQWLSAGAASTPVRLELLQILRYPPNAMLLVFVNGIAVLAAVFMLRSAQDEFGLGVIVLTMVSAWAVGAYGPTRRHHWIYRTTEHPYAWIRPKLVAVGAVWVLLISVHGGWLVLLTNWTLRDLGLLLPTLLIELIVAAAVGVLLPVGRDTSISGAMSDALALALLLAVTSGLQSLLSQVGSVTSILAVQAVALITAFGFLLFVARRSTRLDLAP